jgi:hypothetical protein
MAVGEEDDNSEARVAHLRPSYGRGPLARFVIRVATLSNEASCVLFLTSRRSPNPLGTP